MNKPTFPPDPLAVKESHQKKKLLSFGALSLSVMVHLGLLFLVGGVVIIQAVIPKAEFSGELAPIVEAPTPQAEEQVPEEMTPSPDPTTPETEQKAEAADPAASSMSNDIFVTSVPDANNLIQPQTGNFGTANLPSPSMGSGTATGTSSGPRGKMPAGSAMKSMFGNQGEQSGAFVGHLYDLKQTKDKKPTSMEKEKGAVFNTGNENPKNQAYSDVLAEFCKKGWDEKILETYYKSRDALSIFQFFIPSMNADEAPKAFGVQREVTPSRWVAYYKGNVVAPASGEFRFIGNGDDVLVVRFDGNEVMDGSIRPKPTAVVSSFVQIASPTGPPKTMAAGPWFRMSAGRTYPMEVLIGERPGGAFQIYLLVEQKGKTYEEKNGGKVFPVFQIAPVKIPEKEAGIVYLKDGPIFSRDE